MASALGYITVTNTWQNVITTVPAAADVSVTLQFKHVDNWHAANIVWGGSTPNDNVAVQIRSGDALAGSASAIWVRGDVGILSVMLND
jgi:hypothetical protein